MRTLKWTNLLVWLMTAGSVLAWLLPPHRYVSAWVVVVLRSVGAVHLAAMIPIVARKYVNPRRTSFMRHFARRYSPDGTRAAPVSQRWVPLEDVSEPMQLAVIAGEDPLFPRHNGFDWESIFSAMAYNRTVTTHKRGGSGITQQVAKNLFLWPGPSLTRKLIEAYLTVLIEGVWSKSRILEVYLNVAQFGRTLFGVEAASQRYFARPSALLEEKQAALLAAILPNPLGEFSPATPHHRVRYRQVMILRTMKTLRTDYLRLL